MTLRESTRQEALAKTSLPIRLGVVRRGPYPL